jgi:hypothetical protein
MTLRLEQLSQSWQAKKSFEVLAGEETTAF